MKTQHNYAHSELKLCAFIHLTRWSSQASLTEVLPFSPSATPNENWMHLEPKCESPLHVVHLVDLRGRTHRHPPLFNADYRLCLRDPSRVARITCCRQGSAAFIGVPFREAAKLRLLFTLQIYRATTIYSGLDTQTRHSDSASRHVLFHSERSISSLEWSIRRPSRRSQ
jgi:hypothetical protein